MAWRMMGRGTYTSAIRATVSPAAVECDQSSVQSQYMQFLQSSVMQRQCYHTQRVVIAHQSHSWKYHHSQSYRSTYTQTHARTYTQTQDEICYPKGCAAPGDVQCQCNAQGHLSKLESAPSQRKINVTSKSPVGDISVVTLIRTDITLDHSQEAKKAYYTISHMLGYKT